MAASAKENLGAAVVAGAGAVVLVAPESVDGFWPKENLGSCLK